MSMTGEARMRMLMFAAAIAATAPACLDNGEPNTSTSSQNAETHNRLAANRLAANRLAANRLGANRLAAKSLASTRLGALGETSDILGTVSGRDVYSYIVSCALEPGVTIEKKGVVNYCHSVSVGPNHVADEVCGSTPEPFPVDDPYCTVDPTDNTKADCVYPGSVGLAPQWVDGKLHKDGQGWISACLFARVNLFDTGVGISMRGRNPALDAEVSEKEQFTIEEGAFYGNVFTGTDRKTGEPNPIEWFACRGLDEYRVSTGELPDSGGLALRDCTEPSSANPGTTECGFTFVGNCADFAGSGDEYACRRQDALGNYSECSSKARKKNFNGSERYHQVITVYLAP